MLVDFEDIFSLNVTVMSLGLDAITDTSVGGALSSAMALCIVTVLLKVSVIVPICSTNGVSPVPNRVFIVSMTVPVILDFESFYTPFVEQIGTMQNMSYHTSLMIATR